MLPYMPSADACTSYNDEPGLVAGTHKDFRYAIIRTASKHLCGYVKIPEAHLAYAILYGDLDFSVHGGLTYGAHAEKPFSGYWIGFDCAHAGDFSPKLSSRTEGTYRDLPYVQQQCFNLIDQLITFKPTGKLRLRQELLATLERFKDEEDYPDWKDSIESLHL